MSIDRCEQCDCFIDTDAFPEMYREDVKPGETLCICDECYADIQRNTNKRLLSKLRAYDEAFELIMIGGNHIAGLLSEKLGADFPERYPCDMECEDALRRLCATDAYGS